MINRILIVCLIATALRAQPPAVNLQGEVVGIEAGYSASLSVDLFDLVHHQFVTRVPVSPSGTFEFVRIPPGEYEAQLTTEASVLMKTMVSVREFSPPLLFNLSKSKQSRPNSGAVSLRRLQHKIPKSALKEFERGEKWAAKKDLEKAVEHLEAAVAKDPDFFEAWSSLGKRYLETRRYPDAVTAFGKAVALEPHSGFAYSNLAMGLLTVNRNDEAVVAARRARDLDPTAMKTLYVLGCALLSAQAGSEEGMDLVAKSVQEFPKARLTLALALTRRGETAKAREQLSRYLETGTPENKAQVQAWMSTLR